MFNLIKEIFSIIDANKIRQVLLLQILIIVSNIFEVIGFASIIPFLSVIGNKDTLYSNKYLLGTYELFNMNSFNEFVIFLGVGVFCLVCFSFLLSILKQFLVTRFANGIGFELGNNLFRFYLQQGWIYHSQINTSELTSKISVEAIRVKNIMKSLLQINAQMFFCLFIVIGLIFVNPIVTCISSFIFFVSYVGIYKIVKKILNKNSLILTKTSELRFKTMQEGFGSIRDILLTSRQKYFTDKFDQTGEQFAKTTTENQVVASVPMYFLQTIFLGGIIVYIISMLGQPEGSLHKIIPTLTLFALAGVKLLPACQQIYSNIAQIKSNLSAFVSIKADLYSYQQLKSSKEDSNNDSFSHSDISIENVNFTYPNKSNQALSNINMKISKGNVVAVVGSSGSGKSTLADVITGLLLPNDGRVLFDGKELSKDNRFSWRKSIGYISQSVFLLDGDFYENIAFGEKEYDKSRIDNVIKMAQLESVVSDLPDGLDTIIGEKGVQLSGGQRQRIGIARVLYRESNILILDEATSALDSGTERNILQNILENFKDKTIIMITHRVSTTDICDDVYFIEGGVVVDSGNYADLIERNDKFKQLAGNI